MRTLNDPPGYEREDDDNWTPAIGQRRAFEKGLIAAAVLCVPLAALTWSLPLFPLFWFTRLPIALGVTWLILLVAQRAAGMSSPRVLATGVALGVVTMMTTNAVLAVRGFDELPLVETEYTFPLVSALRWAGQTGDHATRDAWIHPIVLGVTNVSTLAGAILAALWRRLQE